MYIINPQCMHEGHFVSERVYVCRHASSYTPSHLVYNVQIEVIYSFLYAFKDMYYVDFP